MADKYVDISYDTDENSFGTPQNLAVSVTAVTKANPAVVTAAGHGFSNGDIVLLRALGGMTQLNNRSFTVASSATDTFALTGEDSTTHTTYTSGGTATKQMSTNNAIRFIYDDTVRKGQLYDAATRFREWVAKTLSS